MVARTVELSADERESFDEARRNGEVPGITLSSNGILWSGRNAIIGTVDDKHAVFKSTDFAKRLGKAAAGPNRLIARFYQDLLYGTYPIGEIVSAEPFVPLLQYDTSPFDHVYAQGMRFTYKNSAPENALPANTYLVLHEVDNGPTSHWADQVTFSFQNPSRYPIQLVLQTSSGSLTPRPMGGSCALATGTSHIFFNKKRCNEQLGSSKLLMYIPVDSDIRITAVSRIFGEPQDLVEDRDPQISFFGPIPFTWRN